MSGPGATVRAVASVDGGAAARMAVTALLAVGATAAAVAFLVVLAGVVDEVVGGAPVADVAPGLWALVVLAAVRAVALGASEVSGQDASGHLRRAVRGRLVDGLLDGRRTGRAAERGRSGELASVVGDAVDGLDPYVTRFVPAAAAAVAGPVMVMVAIVVLDPLSSLVLVFAGPMLILLLVVIGRRTSTLTRQRLDELGWLTSFFGDLLRGLGTLAASNREADAADRIEEVSRRHGATTMEVLRTAFQTSLVMEWAATAATALVAVEVSFRLVAGDLAFGTALAVLVLTPEFFLPLRRLALEYHAGQTGEAAWDRIEPLLATAPGPAAGAPAPVVPAPRAPAADPAPAEDPAAAEDRVAAGTSGAPALLLRDLWLTHPGASDPALCGLDLELAPGETVALVGPSGAGKTSVASVLLRLAHPDRGRVLVDGEPIEDLDVRAWRRRLAWVPQSPTVFAGTVADNVRLGSPGASDEAVADALRAAGAEAFVAELPRGADTALGEGGRRLSGGQRQRLAVARALLRDAQLVVLDEFTAHLDPDTEAEVVAATGSLLDGRTALVIAHRLATARAADRIAVVDGGRVVDTGSHDELVARCATYASLARDHRVLGPGGAAWA